MLVQDRILAVLAERPGVSRAEIRKAMPDCKALSVTSGIDRLRQAGRIESAGWASYQLAAKKPIEGAKPSKNYKPTVPADMLARMMAG
ncbi:MAG TPA: hypothetical protein VK641_10605 [Terriglobales bacterium]|nr:hypothetical protein [Terriglobales bacterium]